MTVRKIVGYILYDDNSNINAIIIIIIIIIIKINDNILTHKQINGNRIE